MKLHERQQVFRFPILWRLDERSDHSVERFTFTYLSSSRDLLTTKGAKGSAPWIFAGPDFDDAGDPGSAQEQPGRPDAGSPRSMEARGLSFGPLPGTEKEARAIESILPGVKLRMGSQASEAELKQLESPQLLHIATHGFFLADLPTPSSGLRGFDSIGPSASSEVRLLLQRPGFENPLLRSGLALAGANRPEVGAEDGLLTALEASGLDLWGTKLVVLSACETGIGEVMNGEGVFGLRRALVTAGSESQMMSLWKVADEPTKDLMVAYYERLVDGRGRSEALRDVQLEMVASEDRRHPFFWASFILSGDWSPVDLPTSEAD